MNTLPSLLSCCRALRPVHVLRNTISPRKVNWFARSYNAFMASETPSSEDGRDLVFVSSLNLKATAGTDSWHRPKPQPILLSLWLRISVALAGSTDHLPYSIHYGIVCKSVSKLVENGCFKSLEHLAEDISKLALGPELNGEWVKIAIEKPQGLLRADAAGISIIRKLDYKREIVAEGEDHVFVKDLRLVCIIGVNPHEREEKQNVIVSLVLYKSDSKPLGNDVGDIDPRYDVGTITRIVSEYVENSDYKTIEAFVTALAKEICITCGIPKVTVRAEKPSALAFAKAAGVEITREKSFFEIEGATPKDGTHSAFIALGSNLGDRYKNINDAVAKLEEKGLKVKKTSSLYQSAPMYVTDQPTFLNGVCEIETILSPEDLLKELKSIEQGLGRVKTIEKGPRTVDLDILLYDDHTMSTDTLTIPHASMLEREFVLRPLCDIAPNRAHPLTSTAFKHHLAAVPPAPPSTPSLRTFVSIAPHTPPLDPSNPKRNTLIMAVLNLTPDSFSDGGKHFHGSIIPAVQSFESSGASILDIGGQSTRPGAVDVGAEEEICRVIPAIRKIRDAGIDIPISLDTYRASVAREAVKAGANIINDVSAGILDSEMLSTVAELGVPIVLMHTRGTPETMGGLAMYDDIVEDVARELEQRVQAAEEAGIRRWNILLDPGLGFAKNMSHNLELIRRLGELTGTGSVTMRNQYLHQRLSGLPWVLGPSRKRFVGCATGVLVAGERQWGTAGAAAACVAGGADVVRVHDVAEMRKVVDMSVAIWRT